MVAENANIGIMWKYGNCLDFSGIWVSCALWSKMIMLCIFIGRISHVTMYLPIKQWCSMQLTSGQVDLMQGYDQSIAVQGSAVQCSAVQCCAVLYCICYAPPPHIWYIWGGGGWSSPPVNVTECHSWDYVKMWECHGLQWNVSFPVIFVELWPWRRFWCIPMNMCQNAGRKTVFSSFLGTFGHSEELPGRQSSLKKQKNFVAQSFEIHHFLKD